METPDKSSTVLSFYIKTAHPPCTVENSGGHVGRRVLCRSAIHYSNPEVGLSLLFVGNDEVLPGLG